MTVTVPHVVASDTDALAENVVVDLIVGAGDVFNLGNRRRGIGAFGDEGIVCIGIGPISKIRGCSCPLTVDVLVSISVEGVGITAALGEKQDEQCREENCFP